MAVKYEHITWCEGRHDRDGECLLEVQVSGGGPGFDMRAVPCSHVNIQVEGLITEPGQLAELIAALTSVQDRFVASQGEASCDAHDHTDDEED